MIRHITTSDKYKSIRNFGILQPSICGSVLTHGYISFEKNWQSDILIAIMIHAKGWHELYRNNMIVSLEFDELKLTNKLANPNGLPNKNENRVYIPVYVGGNLVTEGILSNEDFNTIGEYAFIKGSIDININTPKVVCHGIDNETTRNAMRNIGYDT